MVDEEILSSDAPTALLQLRTYFRLKDHEPFIVLDPFAEGRNESAMGDDGLWCGVRAVRCAITPLFHSRPDLRMELSQLARQLSTASAGWNESSNFSQQTLLAWAAERSVPMVVLTARQDDDFDVRFEIEGTGICGIRPREVAVVALRHNHWYVVPPPTSGFSDLPGTTITWLAHFTCDNNSIVDFETLLRNIREHGLDQGDNAFENDFESAANTDMIASGKDNIPINPPLASNLHLYLLRNIHTVAPLEVFGLPVENTKTIPKYRGTLPSMSK